MVNIKPTNSIMYYLSQESYDEDFHPIFFTMSFNDSPFMNLPVELACLVKWAVSIFVFMPAALSFAYLLIVCVSMSSCL